MKKDLIPTAGCEQSKIYIPTNEVIGENGYFSHVGIVNMLRKYKNNPKAIQFIADMME